MFRYQGKEIRFNLLAIVQNQREVTRVSGSSAVALRVTGVSTWLACGLLCLQLLQQKLDSTINELTTLQARRASLMDSDESTPSLLDIPLLFFCPCGNRTLIFLAAIAESKLLDDCIAKSSCAISAIKQQLAEEEDRWKNWEVCQLTAFTFPCVASD